MFAVRRFFKSFRNSKSVRNESSVGSLPAEVDQDQLPVFVSPAFNGVEISQREAERIDLAMAFVARCAFPILLELLANRDARDHRVTVIRIL